MAQHPYGRDERAFRDALDLWFDKHREEAAALLHARWLASRSSLAGRITGLIC